MSTAVQPTAVSGPACALALESAGFETAGATSYSPLEKSST